jgi:hypothetical protein
MNDSNAWLLRLKTAYDAGYYRTEAAVGSQVAFPWQNKACADCPFWVRGTCAVHLEYRSGTAHTCIYFDQANRDAGRAVIASHGVRAFERWWEEFNRRRPRR